MGWAIGTGIDGRDIGYSVPAVCDRPNCKERIDRGLSHCCGGYTKSDEGCGLYFCSKHLYYGEDHSGNSAEFCNRCLYNLNLPDDAPSSRYLPTHKPKLDIIEWILWKLSHPSWRKWRNTHKREVRGMQKRVIKYVENLISKETIREK